MMGEQGLVAEAERNDPPVHEPDRETIADLRRVVSGFDAVAQAVRGENLPSWSRPIPVARPEGASPGAMRHQPQIGHRGDGMHMTHELRRAKRASEISLELPTRLRLGRRRHGGTRAWPVSTAPSSSADDSIESPPCSMMWERRRASARAATLHLVVDRPDRRCSSHRSIPTFLFVICSPPTR
jgi:hypothetical protein